MPQAASKAIAAALDTFPGTPSGASTAPGQEKGQPVLRIYTDVAGLTLADWRQFALSHPTNGWKAKEIQGAAKGSPTIVSAAEKSFLLGGKGGSCARGKTCRHSV